MNNDKNLFLTADETLSWLGISLRIFKNFLIVLGK